MWITLGRSMGTPGRAGDRSPGRRGQRIVELNVNSVYIDAQEEPSRQRLRKRWISSVLRAPAESLPSDRSPALPGWPLTNGIGRLPTHRRKEVDACRRTDLGNVSADLAGGRDQQRSRKPSRRRSKMAVHSLTRPQQALPDLHDIPRAHRDQQIAFFTIF